MKVKTIEPHGNSYGVLEREADYDKKKGDIYSIDDDAHAQTLIDAGLVEKVKHGGSDSKGGGSAGA